jgi:hypothetical protein
MFEKMPECAESGVQSSANNDLKLTNPIGKIPDFDIFSLVEHSPGNILV